MLAYAFPLRSNFYRSKCYRWLRADLILDQGRPLVGVGWSFGCWTVIGIIGYDNNILYMYIATLFAKSKFLIPHNVLIMNICISKYIYTYACTYVHMYVCIYNLVAWQIPEEWTRMLMQNFYVHVCTHMYVCVFRHTHIRMYVCMYMVLCRFQEPAEVASLNKMKTCKCECECFVFTAPGQTGWTEQADSYRIFHSV